MNRFSFLKDSIPKYLENCYIDELIICDETGEDYNLITTTFQHPKLKVYKNKSRLGALRNKLLAASLATSEYICVLDSDNFANIDYFKAFLDYIHDCKNVDIYLPSRANPKFIYDEFSGLHINKTNLHENYDKHFFPCLMNTMNCIFTKNIIHKLINTILHDEDIDKCYAADADYVMVYSMMELNATIAVVPEMNYDHRVHDGSYWIETSNESSLFMDKLRHKYGF